MCIRDSIQPVWTRRSDPMLLKADAGSKGLDTDEWALPDDVYQMLLKYWGEFSIDLFANGENARSERFYSRYWDEKGLGIDAFSFDWTDEKALIVPPVSISLRALKKATSTRMEVVFIVPLWPHAKFWVHLMPDGRHTTENVTEIKVFYTCLLYTSPSPRDLSTSRMPSSA